MDITVFDIALVPLIIGLIAVINSMGFPKRFSPFVALILGVFAGVFYVAPTDIAQGVLSGLALGLSAVGLYSGTKNTYENLSEKIK